MGYDGAAARATGGRPGGPSAAPVGHGRRSDDARRGLSRRQVRRPVGRGLHDRHPGAGQVADDAASERPCGRARHGLPDLRLPRLAARQFRPGAVAGAALPGEARRAVPARRQRRPGGHRPLGHPAGGPLPGAKHDGVFAIWYGKGAGRRPHHGRLQARQQRRNRRPWRRARAGRRRSCLRLLDDGAPERVRLHERRHAGAQPGRRAGVPGLWPARLGSLPLRRPLGRLHLHRRDGGQFGRRLGGPAPRRHRGPRRRGAAAGRAQHPLAGHAARPGGTPARTQARRSPRLRPGEPARTVP